jgi:hypothetical protein
MANPRKKRQSPRDIDAMLQDWPYDVDTLSVRIVRGSDGRDVIQMRVDLGLLQMETSGRPDGTRPRGEPTYYDYLLGRSLEEGDNYELSEEECLEADREFSQFYHRRICWLVMREFSLAVRDADHTLGLMDLCRHHSPDEEWTLSHEQFRPMVLAHRIQASALAALDESEESGPERAVQAVNDGLNRLRQVFADFEADDEFEDHELVVRLKKFREALRERFHVGRTLQEQLADAVAAEKYELAARIRDALHERGRAM